MRLRGADLEGHEHLVDDRVTVPTLEISRQPSGRRSTGATPDRSPISIRARKEGIPLHVDQPG